MSHCKNHYNYDNNHPCNHHYNCLNMNLNSPLSRHDHNHNCNYHYSLRESLPILLQHWQQLACWRVR